MYQRRCVGIYDRAAEFARGLGRAFTAWGKERLDIKVYTSLQVLLEAGNKTEPDLLLVDEETFETQFAKGMPGAKILVLSEHPDREQIAVENGIARTARYQPAAALWQAFLEAEAYYFSEAECGRRAGENAVFFGVASPIHRCGKTRMSLKAAEYLADRGRTLMISLDEFPGAQKAGPGADLTELFYYYMQGSMTTECVRTAAASVRSMACLSAAGTPEDLYWEGEPYAPEFYQEVAEKGAFRYVVLDLGNSLAGKSGLLKLCSLVITPEGRMQSDPPRMKQFLDWAEGNGVKDRIVLIPAGSKREGEVEQLLEKAVEEINGRTADRKTGKRTDSAAYGAPGSDRTSGRSVFAQSDR